MARILSDMSRQGSFFTKEFESLRRHIPKKGGLLLTDHFVTFMEIYGGLAVVHDAQWKSTTGAYKNHPNFFYRLGDLQKSTMLKFSATQFACCIALAACANWS